MNRNTLYSLEEALRLREAEPASIEKKQLGLLKDHLKHAAVTPYYRELFTDYGVDVSNLLSVGDLSGLPFTHRCDLDAVPEKFGLQQSKQFQDIALTSGTSGKPVVVPYTAADLERLAFNEAVAFSSAGVREGDRVLLTVTLDRCFIAGLAYYSGVTLLGATAIRNGPGQPARQWHIIETLKPRVVVGVPSFLNELGLWGKENGIDVGRSSINTIITIGESVKRADHSLTALGLNLKSLWQADIFSSYGATEFETAFGECRESSGGHVHPELMLVEIIDDEGNCAPDGQPGEVVVTPLGVEGFPLVRFRTGDIARCTRLPCDCGWNTMRLGAVEGRLAQRLKYKGTTFYPETIFHAIEDIPAISASYVEVRRAADGADDVKVVVGSDEPELDIVQIEEYLQAHLRVRPRIEVHQSERVVARMAEEGGRKAKKFFDLRGRRS